jgi:hypothetical protein
MLNTLIGAGVFHDQFYLRRASFNHNEHKATEILMEPAAPICSAPLIINSLTMSRGAAPNLPSRCRATGLCHPDSVCLARLPGSG